MVSRKPPKKIREILRREVNFGCPVPGCESPYLTWHHFDPPWRDMQHHNPKGMIALCPTHAAQADADRWTKEQLGEMKQNPFVTEDKISEFYGYLRKNVVCKLGSFYYYMVQNILEINGERTIGFEKDDEGYNRLNLLVRDTKGRPILVMENNDWTAYTKFACPRCSAQGRKIEITSNDGLTDLEMRFDDYSITDFQRLLLSNSFTRNEVEWFTKKIGSPESVPTWTAKGTLHWGNRQLNIRDPGITDDRNIHFGRGMIVRQRAGFKYTDNSIAI